MSETEPSPARLPELVPGRSPWSEFFARLQAGEAPVAGAALLGVVALVAGLLWYQAGIRGTGEAAALPPPAPAASHHLGSTTTTGAALLVHVAGAVAHPGLYRLRPGDRVADALAVAGGAAPKADTDRLNLAAKVADGQRVAVPRLGEAAPGLAADTGGGGGAAGPAPAGAVVDLNTATQADLETLPGVGPATAQRILAQRERQNGFRSVQDLRKIPGIGDRRFAELRDRVRV